LAALILAMFALQPLAAPDDAARGEIEYLLGHLETSGCDFFRNGDWHDASRARRHIERKYDWLVRRDLVASAEQFIERAATESSRSGEAYLVRCGQGDPVASAVWMTDALARFRNGAEPAREE
jgi:hypothetical protein